MEGQEVGSRARCGSALLAAACLFAAAAAAPAAAAAQQAPKPPNIVLIMTDDQPTHTVTPEVMPNLFKRVIEPGTSFSDFIVTTPLCCPSRATLLTGQYGHNNGVLRNDYADLVAKGNVLPRWLRRAGYETAFLGKWLNGYESAVRRPGKVAPGWDRWFAQLAERRYYNWSASLDGRRVDYGYLNRHHATAVTTRVAARWTRRMLRRETPFFLYASYWAPHVGRGRGDAGCGGAPTPLSQDIGLFPDAAAPRGPAFDEADVSDKPSFVAERAPLTDAAQAEIDRRYRCTLQSLRGVDRGIGRIHRRIARAGELRNTVFIFTSDNGFFFGEHRIPAGKELPYEENLRVPLAVRLPPRQRGKRPPPAELDAASANIDLAPTILDLAGAEPCAGAGCRAMDGRSLLPLLRGEGSFPAERPLLIEAGICAPWAHPYRGLRRGGQLYLEHHSERPRYEEGCEPGELEHYDLSADPHQLSNLYPAGPDTPAARFQEEAARELARLAACAGLRGRERRAAGTAFCG